jgi:hypothetical protein
MRAISKQIGKPMAKYDPERARLWSKEDRTNPFPVRAHYTNCLPVVMERPDGTETAFATITEAAAASGTNRDTISRRADDGGMSNGVWWRWYGQPRQCHPHRGVVKRGRHGIPVIREGDTVPYPSATAAAIAQGVCDSGIWEAITKRHRCRRRRWWRVTPQVQRWLSEHPGVPVNAQVMDALTAQAEQEQAA